MDGSDIVRRPPFGDNPLVGERGATTRRRILAAALDVFAEHGFHDTRVELITEAAGCSRPAFYQYFASKDEVFWHLAGRLAREMDAVAEHLRDIPGGEDGLAPVQEWIRGMIDLQESYAPIFASFEAASREQASERQSSRGINTHIGEALIDVAGASHRDLDRHEIAGAIATTLLRTIHYYRLGLGQLGETRFVDGLSRTVHRLLHGPVTGVNVQPVKRPPKRRAPAWPDFPGLDSSGDDLRPRGRMTRQRLLDAGARVLPQRGFHDTRVDDIVDVAGVSHGSFYRYFSNKDELFHVLAEQAARRMVDLVQTFPENPAGPELVQWLSIWFREYRENGGVISEWQEIGQDDPELSEFSLAIAVVLFDRLDRIVHGRDFGDSSVDALVLLSVIERLPYTVLALEYLDDDDAVAASAFLIRRGILGHVDG